MAKLHYDKNKLHEEYHATFKVAMWALGITLAIGLIYFFIFVVYLGGVSHTKHEPMVKQFGDRIDFEYEGLKLPIHSEE